MTGRRRRELADSFGLVGGEERWLPADLAVGALALVVWVAGTGALATQAGSAAGVPLGIESGELPSPVAVGLFAGLWLVVPAAAFVVRLRQRMLNLRGNVEQYYRFDHPAALLVPPALLAAGTVGAAFALGRVPWYLTLLFVPVGLFALVRTLAYSYRVYGFSHPLVLQAGAFVATVAALAGAFGAVATATGRGELVRQSLWAVGLSEALIGAVTVGPLAVTWPGLAVLAPVVVALAYVVVQTVVALVVRAVKPEVDRSKMRTGQRYPPFLDAATPTQSASPRGGTASAESSGDSGPADTQDADVDADPAAGESDDADDEADLDDVSNTRVFTPPADGDGQAFGSGTTAGADTDASPADETRAVTSSDDGEVSDDVAGGAGDETGDSDSAREHCDVCGESFTVDTAVRFCPNCGAALEGE